MLHCTCTRCAAAEEMGGSQGEIKAVKADNIEAPDEPRGAKNNCGCATEEMGAGEGEEDWLTS